MARVISGLLLVCTILTGCGSKQATAPVPPDARVRALADTYLKAYFIRNPDQVTLYGVVGYPQDRLPDNSLESLAAWQRQEDGWLAELSQIDPATIEDRPLQATYAILREALEGAVAKRVCRDELWNVSQMTGWHISTGYLVTIQPVDTEAARAAALARWGALPGYVDVEIANLRKGLELGYTASAGTVRIVAGQVQELAASKPGDSPFLSPGQRAKDEAFAKAIETLVTERINPAARRYAEFLEREYLPRARQANTVTANPQGAACYDASVRFHSSTRKTAAEVHQIGLAQIELLTAEMKVIGERSFHQPDVAKLLVQARTDPNARYKSREDLIAYSQAALERARLAVPKVFGLLPKADVVIRPYPAYREKNAPNEYNSPAEDGSRPGLFLISAYEAEKKSRVEDESTAFHETIPGHHLQGAIALERKQIHPIGRYIWNSGYVEGWGLYAERVADELGLFTGDLDRLGMLSGQALRASRLVVDTGLHTMGWTRQQAIDYMLAHTAEPEHDVASEVDRYIAWPGQATAYMLGEIEIRAARAEAEKAMGARFDLKGFHDRVLEDGGVPLTFLRAKIAAWSGGQAK